LNSVAKVLAKALRAGVARGGQRAVNVEQTSFTMRGKYQTAESGEILG